MKLLSGKIFDVKFAFVVIATLVSINLWSFLIIPDAVFDGLKFLLLIALIAIVLIYDRNNDITEKLFQTNVRLLIWLPILSSFGAFLFHDQSFTLSLLILRTNFFWLLYFVLHLFNISPKKIIQLILFVGFVWIFLTVIQQFTYPAYFFSNRNEEDNYDFYRAGVYRFMIDQHQYGLFVILYYYNRFLKKRTFKPLIPVLLGLVGYYYYSGRQYALAAVACLFLATLTTKGTFKVYATCALAAIAAGLFLFKDVLFADYVEMTNEQLNSDDDVRLVAAKFFLFDYWPHWITTIIGNGYENYKSSYGKEMLYINQVKLLFRSDIGIIGMFNMFGIFYVINVLWLNFKGLSNKYYSSNTSYLKYVFIYSLLLLPLSEGYSVPSGAVPFFCFIFYLADKAYEEKSIEEMEIEIESASSDKRAIAIV